MDASTGLASYLLKDHPAERHDNERPGGLQSQGAARELRVCGWGSARPCTFFQVAAAHHRRVFSCGTTHEGGGREAVSRF